MKESTGSIRAFAKMLDEVMPIKKKQIRFANISVSEWRVMRGLYKIGTIRKIDNTEYRLFHIGNPYPECFDSLEEVQEDVIEHW